MVYKTKKDLTGAVVQVKAADLENQNLRSANGVFLISTQKGKGGKPTITFNSNIGLNVLAKMPHMLHGNELVNFRMDYEAAEKYRFIPEE